MKIIIKHLKQTFSVNLTLAAFVKIISERFVVPCTGTDKGAAGRRRARAVGVAAVPNISGRVGEVGEAGVC